MIIRDRAEILSRIKHITEGDTERVINIEANDIKPLIESSELVAIELEAEDLANIAVTALKECQEANSKGKKNVLLTITCSRSYGLTMVDMEKISCVMRTFDEGTDLLWGVSYDNTMPMNKIRMSITMG